MTMMMTIRIMTIRMVMMTTTTTMTMMIDLYDDQPVPGVTESGLSEGRLTTTSFATCRVPIHHGLDDDHGDDLDDDLDDDIDPTQDGDLEDDLVFQSDLVLTLLPRLGESAALVRVGVTPPPIRGELFGQVDVPRSPPAPSVLDPMAMLGQELPMVLLVGWWGWWWLW